MKEIESQVKYRFAVQILFFDCEQFILRTIANCAPFVEKIFITYSPEPWSAYNKNARDLFKNPSNPEILKQSPHFGKVELIEGIWDTEEEQRNDCLKKAKEQGFDYLIIQDADEFYLPEEYEKNIQGIATFPNYNYYRNPWYFFWKSTNVRPYLKTPLGFNECFANQLPNRYQIRK